MEQHFRAYVVREAETGRCVGEIVGRPIDALPEGDLLVRVSHSALNYKDALSTRGNRGVTKSYPHTPGIDAVGEVVEDARGHYALGDRVVVTGHDLGMNTPGGWGGCIRVPGSWAIPLPKGLSPLEAAALGTAGLTAAMAAQSIVDNGPAPGGDPVVVTGATGGVGGMAIAILAEIGYEVVAVSGKQDAGDYLRGLGAARVIGRGEVGDASDRPLLRSRWAAAADGVGGDTLANLLRTMGPRGVIASYGNAGGHALSTTVYPFILRGVRLIGVDSASCPMPQRETLWERLAGTWKPEALERMTRVVTLEALDEEVTRMLEGGGMGRVVVAHEAV